MKIKLKVFLPTVVMILFALSLTGYAHGKHHESDETKANTSLKNPSSISADDSLISRWLEAQLTQGSPTSNSRDGEAIFGTAWLQEFGGGWCDFCGCWLRHGPDGNGNSGNGHVELCSDIGGNQWNCFLHEQNCSSSGGGGFDN